MGSGLADNLAATARVTIHGAAALITIGACASHDVGAEIESRAEMPMIVGDQQRGARANNHDLEVVWCGLPVYIDQFMASSR